MKKSILFHFFHFHPLTNIQVFSLSRCLHLIFNRSFCNKPFPNFNTFSNFFISLNHILGSIISVKQGDILGPKLFTIFIAAIMITWRKRYDRLLCIFGIKKDFILTWRRPTTKGINFSLSDSEYANGTAVLFHSRERRKTFLIIIESFLKTWNVGPCWPL